uniref:beta-N-acetylhexosaminidase n=1 Tax=uncultured Proteiniphilum sp. TaxID=497637 RepID=UPI0026275B67
IFFFSLSLFSNEISVIPKPLKMDIKNGSFNVNTKTKITCNDKKLIHITDFLNDFLRENYDLRLDQKISKKTGKQEISFILDNSSEKESYTLHISQNSIVVRGGESGLFYGLQTLLQLMPLEKSPSVTLPQVEIQDKPRFKYRGAMLDVGRYFYTPDEVKKFIDLMAHYKLNTFHWHLTEDAGWRIEIKKYPLLTKIGAWRRGTQSSHPAESFDRLPHGGFYTQAQIKDIVSYAEKRNITIIPEIDMPGHTLAVLAACPEISCTGGPFKVLEAWGVQKDVMCAGNEQTYKFIEDVLDELLEMFPSQIIHIGGDEAPKERWKECPKCQEKISIENLKNEAGLQSYFVKRVGSYLQSKGRKMLGWDEIMEGGLAENAMVMSWRGEESGIEAAKMHHEVVMAPTAFMYLDYYQGDHETEPVNFNVNLPLEKVYSYEPLSSRIPVENYKYIIGVQGNIWTEYIHNYSKIEYMAFPRLLAVAEIGWSDAEKDFDDFSKRLSNNLNWLDKKGVNFRIPDVAYSTTAIANTGDFDLVMQPSVKEANIYYTLNGDDPMLKGTLYHSPIRIIFEDNNPVQLKYIVRTRTGRVSGTRVLNFDK